MNVSSIKHKGHTHDKTNPVKAGMTCMHSQFMVHPVLLKENLNFRLENGFLDSLIFHIFN